MNMVGLLCRSTIFFFQSLALMVLINSDGKVISQATQTWVVPDRITDKSSNSLLFLYGVSMKSCD